MALSSETNSTSTVVTSITQQDFQFGHPYFEEADLVVQHTDGTTNVVTTLDLTTGYTVSATNGDTYGGATVSTASTWTIGDTIEIKREVALTQDYDLQNGATVSPTSLNRAIDRAVAMSQQLNEQIEDLLTISTAIQGYSITDPTSGDVTTFNPNTATFGEVCDFLATLAKDIKG